jgi:hypothetical protein
MKHKEGTYSEHHGDTKSSKTPKGMHHLMSGPDKTYKEKYAGKASEVGKQGKGHPHFEKK